MKLKYTSMLLKKKKLMRLIHNKNICYQFCQIIIEKNNNKLIKTNS